MSQMVTESDICLGAKKSLRCGSICFHIFSRHSAISLAVFTSYSNIYGAIDFVDEFYVTPARVKQSQRRLKEKKYIFIIREKKENSVSVSFEASADSHLSLFIYKVIASSACSLTQI